MRNNVPLKPHIDRQAPKPVSRRALLQGAGGAAGLSALLAASVLAQDPQLREVIRQMSAMTNAPLPEPWVEPTTGLVGVILDYSKTLRALDLGEREPATSFQAR
jgi:hypothetical protein